MDMFVHILSSSIVMQGKVSMVMPCYNKVEYIGEMFDSIIAQDWDNIELILVNDGSTDGTGEVIGRYEPRFRGRGFEVVIINQENAGVCAAAKAGLERITGDYVCMVDADDELDPKYVSTMAGWLDEHKEYDYCICDAVLYTGSDKQKQFRPFSPSDIYEDSPYYTEQYLFVEKIRSEVWVYMVRREYIEACRIIEMYYTDTKGSHEPGFIIPLTVNKGKYKCFPLPLYHFNVGSQGHSKCTNAKQAYHYHNEYNKLCQIAIRSLPNNLSDQAKKNQLSSAAFLSHCYMCLYSLESPPSKEVLDHTVTELMGYIHTFLPYITKSHYANREFFLLLAVKNKLLGKFPKLYATPRGKIIGYGALGRAASALLPYLKGTPIEPTELWDIAGDGEGVKKPDFASLKNDDLVIVLPKRNTVWEQVEAMTDCHLMSNKDACDYLSYLFFKDAAEDGEKAFNPKGGHKIKMLVAYPSFSVGGGGERFLLDFLTVFPESLYQIDLLLFDDMQDDVKMYDAVPANINILPFLKQYSRWSPELINELRASGHEQMAEIKTFIHSRNLEQSFKELPIGFRYEENWKELKKLCPYYKGYDVAVAFSHALSLKIIAEKVFANKKFVFLHVDGNAMINGSSYNERIFCYEQPYYEQMDGIICVTEQNALSFCNYFPTLRNKVKVLTNINNADAIYRKANEFYPQEYDRNSFNILTVARISPQKGIDTLLKSAYLLKKNGLIFKWFILGNKIMGTSYLEKCLDIVKALGIVNDVVFLGARPNPFPYYKNCDLYVHTSLYEGRPLAIEEAMILNCPIVTTNFSSVTDQITDGVNGKICKMEPDSIAEAILTLFHNAEERSRLAASNFSYKGVTDIKQYLDCFC